MKILEGQYLEDIIEKEKILLNIYRNRRDLFDRFHRLYNRLYNQYNDYGKANKFMREYYSHIIGDDKK